jgi:hypothetical protein
MEKTWLEKNKFFSILLVCMLIVTSLSCMLIVKADPPDDFTLKWTCALGMSSTAGMVRSAR